MSKSTIIVRELSHNESGTESLTMPQYSAISEHSSVKGTPKHIREWLMSSREDSLVKTYPFVKKMPLGSKGNGVDCGWKWQKSFVKLDLYSFYWKTRQHSLLVGLDEYSETWPSWGTMQDGEC